MNTDDLMNKKFRETDATRIDDAIGLEEYLTGWEQNFLKSIKKQVANKCLSDKQEAVLKKIERKIVDGLAG